MPMSRRELFRRLGGQSDTSGPKVAYTSQAPRQRVLPIIRPPGALEEEGFQKACRSGCQACLEACPHGVIVAANSRHPQVAGTPTLRPEMNPCLMCADKPCIQACPTGALEMARANQPIAELHWASHACLAQHSFCRTCVEQCPVEDAIVYYQNRIEIRMDTCSGCGVCAYVCPAPQKALALLPTRQKEVTS